MQNFVNSLNLLCDMQIQVYTNLGPRVYEIWTLVVCTLICYLAFVKQWWFLPMRGCRGHDRDGMVVGFTTTYAISAYHHWCCEFESRSEWGVQHYMIKVCHCLATGPWFSPGPPVSSTNKSDHQDIIEILLKVTIKQTNKSNEEWQPHVSYIL
jgi:hypothetical protein